MARPKIHPGKKKHCGKCGRDRAFACFATDHAKPDGLRTICKACDNSAHRVRAAKRKLNASKASRAWTPERREAQRQRMKAVWRAESEVWFERLVKAAELQGIDEAAWADRCKTQRREHS